jgi:hypothetical protein
MTWSSSYIRRSLRHSRWLVVVETVLVAVVFLADWNHLVIFSKTPYLLVIAALSLWLRDVRWSPSVSAFRSIGRGLSCSAFFSG